MRISRASERPNDGDGRYPERNERFARARDLRYEEMFGKDMHVLHERDQRKPHVDVYIFAPREGMREICTIVTSGMSDRIMNTPQPVGNSFSRAELILYCREPHMEYANMLRMIAHYPHEDETWLGPGHTLQQAKLLDLDGKGARFAGCLFLSPPIEEDGKLPKRLRLDGTAVNLLWVIPITAQELALAQRQGTDALLNVMFERGLSFVFDPTRESYVQDGRA